MLLFLALPILLFISFVITFVACALAFMHKVPYKRFLNASISILGLITYIVVDNYLMLIHENLKLYAPLGDQLPLLLILSGSIFIQLMLPSLFQHTLTVAVENINAEELPYMLEKTLKLHRMLVIFCVFYFTLRILLSTFNA